MKLIVITRPDFFPGEAEAITTLFYYGLEILHCESQNLTLQKLKVY